MFFADDLLLQARLDELHRDLSRIHLASEARRLNRPQPERTAPSRAKPLVRRVNELMTELYGPGQPFETDPGLFARLGWIGIDD